MEASPVEHEAVPLYDAAYGKLTDRVYEAIRRETWGEDLGQASWVTAVDLDTMIPLLNAGPDSHVLDIACGSGGIACRIAERTGCSVTGVDIHPDAISQAAKRPQVVSLGNRAVFRAADASRPLEFPDGSLNAIVCIDAINHLPGRAAVLRDWHRVLSRGGRLVFTDPVVVTGLVDAREFALRASIGTFLFSSPGANERLLQECGLRLVEVRDETEALAVIAERWRAARERKEQELRSIEGERSFSGQQEFLRVSALLAQERRLSRLLYAAEKR